MTSLLGVGGVDWDKEEEREGGYEYVLWICWGRAGGGRFELGGARLWSVAGVLRTIGAMGVCESTMRDVLLEGVESAWLDAVPVEVEDDEAGDNNGGVVVGIHDNDDNDDRIVK